MLHICANDILPPASGGDWLTLSVIRAAVAGEVLLVAIVFPVVECCQVERATAAGMGLCDCCQAGREHK